jgi:cell division protein FtsQ
VNVSVDPRLAARRRHVQEGWARRRLRWMLVLVGLVLLLGAGIALFQSPWLAVRSVAIAGAANAPVDEILARHALSRGTPSVSLRPGPIEDSLERDPWIAEAEVRVTWPGTIEVTVVERSPAAWVRVPDGWALVARDGMVVATGTPEEGAPRVRAPQTDGRIGAPLDNDEMVAAAEFLGLLTPELAVGASARLTAMGIELEIAGHRVLAGNGRDIAAKVATLEAMFANGIPRGAVINVISPTRPGTLNPQSVIEGTQEEVSSFEETG